ncbi:hypothetical protein QTN47_22620 [Danxiaibacter flavus]|uniref:Carbohydrate-binding domain-containing protein n=1 Tax=Danxiaibacter flavus TaxID=3049108 RepID=A0ABV3ZKE9_9BACT|nr:hypothetical protein QNM32_22625 [Chitinophagaceae bacterium DXS]
MFCLDVVFFQSAISQNKKILALNFDEPEYLRKEMQKKYYMIDPYLPAQKAFVTILSSADDTVYANTSCFDTSSYKYGNYISLTLYRKGSLSRNLFVIKLDTALCTDKRYRIRYDSKYHMYTNYQVDSLQVLFVKEENDIKRWLAGKPFNGMYVDFSLARVNNRRWQSVAKDFVSDGDYRYMVIGNLKDDEPTGVNKVNNCPYSKKPKGYWDYSELFVGNIFIDEY